MTDLHVGAAARDASAATNRPHRLAWALALLVLLTLPLVPAAWMLFIAWRASELGCLADQTHSCIDGTTELGPSLQLAIEAAVDFAVLLGFGILPWLLLCFFVLRRVFASLWARLSVAAAITLVLAHGPFVAPVNIFVAFDPDACLLNGLLVIQCEVLGSDLRKHAEHLVTALPVAFWQTLPLAGLTYLVYLVVEVVQHWRKKRRAEAAMFAADPPNSQIENASEQMPQATKP